MLTYGNITRDPATLPAATIEAMLQRTFTHMLSNEVASHVVGMVRAQIGDDATKDMVTAWKEANPASITSWVADKQAEILGKIDSGTLGVRVSRGPSVDPVAKIVHQLAKEGVVSKLRSLNLHSGKADPKGDASFVLGRDTFSLDELIARAVTRDGEKFTVEANRILTVRAREAKQREARLAAIAQATPAGEGEGAEAMGL